MSEDRFHCLGGCGDSWDADPRLGVACPDCGARAGVPCIAPSGHTKATGFSQPHKARRTLAFSLNPCGCLAKWDREHAADTQLSLLGDAR